LISEGFWGVGELIIRNNMIAPVPEIIYSERSKFVNLVEKKKKDYLL